jgi:hypothetical protein
MAVAQTSSTGTRRRWPRVRGSTLVAVAVLAIWGSIIPYSVEQYLGGDYRVLLRLGTDFPHPAALRGVPFTGETGYDGQFFAALATDPLLLRPDTPSTLDAPLYRAGRIGMPLLAWALALGSDSAAIVVYQLLCWVLGALCAGVAARWLEHEGRSPLWAAPLAFSGGVFASMFSSLPDAAACTLLLAALWLHARRRAAWLPVLAFACLVKETNYVAALAIAVAELRERRFTRAALSVAVPVALIAAWRLWVLSRPGFANAALVTENFGVPFAWIPAKLGTPLDALEVVGLAGLALSFAGLAALLPGVRRAGTVELSFVGFGLMALFLNELVYVPVWWNYSRVLLPLPALAAVAAERAEPAWRRWLLRAVAASWSVLGILMLPWWAAGLAALVALLESLRRFAGGAESARATRA